MDATSLALVKVEDIERRMNLLEQVVVGQRQTIDIMLSMQRFMQQQQQQQQQQPLTTAFNPLNPSNTFMGTAMTQPARHNSGQQSVQFGQVGQVGQHAGIDSESNDAINTRQGQRGQYSTTTTYGGHDEDIQKQSDSVDPECALRIRRYGAV
jgi:hypothetical protein